MSAETITNDNSGGVTISSSTLFHFTRSYENLIGILQNEFQPRLCLEELGSISAKRSDEAVAFPMVCFCDIPLSQTSKHLSRYGNRGIGLTKEWAQRNGISPVLYAHPESAVWQQIWRIYHALTKHDGGVGFQDTVADLLFPLFAYIKPYEGRMWRDDSYVERVRFYDEREWRYVPQELVQERWYRGKEDFLQLDIVEKVNSTVAVSAKLSFEPNDIRYIIVADDSEVLPMMDAVLRIKGKKYTHDDLRMLTTRIISAEQIREDF